VKVPSPKENVCKNNKLISGLKGQLHIWQQRCASG